LRRFRALQPNLLQLCNRSIQTIQRWLHRPLIKVTRFMENKTYRADFRFIVFARFGEASREQKTVRSVKPRDYTTGSQGNELDILLRGTHKVVGFHAINEPRRMS